MRGRIYKNLLLMGVAAVLLTFVLSGILYYQGAQEQFSKELRQLTSVVATAISEERENTSREYLENIYEKQGKKIHVVWINKEGKTLYDSDGMSDRDYGIGEEVKQAREKGEGQVVHKDAYEKPKSYFAAKAPDGSILRMSSVRSVSYSDFSGYIPEIIMFLIVFFVGCLAAAERLTEKIVKPFHLLGDVVKKIMNDENIDDVGEDYKELRPLIKKLEEQHNEIRSYMEDIEEDRNTMRTVIDTISDGIILLNDNKEILDYNKRIQEIFNPSENKRYRRIASLYHDEDWLRVIGKAYRSDEPLNYTMNLFGKPFRIILKNMELIDGTHVLLIVLRDMTASYMAEKMRREFSANVSHELKTPLTSISGFAEMIANGMYEKPEDVKIFGARIMNESRRMMSLIDTIMHLSKIEEQETTITWKIIAMDSLVRYAADLVMPQASAKNVTINVHTESLYTYGNAALLSELIMNLLDNGIKYNNDDGEIQVELKPEGEDKLSLSISDTGIGIPKDKQDRVFERFYRIDESRNKETGGSGLGLAICKHIVEKHKGELLISSEEGNGTTVTVLLPRMNDADVSKEIAESLDAQREAEEAESGKLAQLEAEEDRIQLEENRKEEKEPKRRKGKKDKKDKKKKKASKKQEAKENKEKEAK